MPNRFSANDSAPTLLLLGFGQINQRVAKRLKQKFRITAVSRSPKEFEGVGHIALNLNEANLSQLPDADYILYCLTPSHYDEAGYHEAFISGLTNVMERYAKHSPRHFFFVSSTSVYSQHNGEVIDESSPTDPIGYSGKVLLSAEKLLKESPASSTVVRFSGIYGHKRTRLLEQIRKGERSSHPPSDFTNRISEDDVVGCLCHLLQLATENYPLADCYLASDNEPVEMHKVVAWIREHTPCEPENSSPTPRRAGSKRCNNQRLKGTGFRFQHPTFREGYGEIIRQQNNAAILP